MSNLISIYERAAKNIRKLEPYLSVIAGGLFISSFFAFDYLPKQWAFVLVIVMLWFWGVALVGHMFHPSIEIEIDGRKKMVSKLREEHPIMRGYSTIFMTIWFFFLLIITFKFILR